MNKQNEKELNLDFMSKFEPKDRLSAFLKKGIYSLHYKVNYTKLAKWSVKIALCVAIGVSFTSFFNYLNNKNQETSSIETEKINEQKKIISQLTQEDIDKTILFIKLTQKIQNNRMKDFYWKFKYVVGKEPKRYTLEKTMRKISKMNHEMNDFYNNRVIGIGTNYQIIKNGGKEMVEDQPIQKILYWYNAMNSGIVATYTELDTFLAQWDEDFVDHKAIEQYLHDNKVSIEASSPFM